MKNNFLHKTIKKPKHGWDKEHYIYHCTDGEHPSFHFTMITSPEWKAWRDYNNTEMIFDISECEDCGWISSEHFQEFLKFTIKQANKIPFKGKIK